ncbi:MAG: tagatose 1,6-diphosphate aldolase GatY/KbaY [Thermoanaerobacterium sp.]|nr:tagatose 1,6-diphosphate aldolase GatY/KbaY [Thermoanaerobacterium sp.]MDI3529289.1 tagatose 1,6-diphosphate aldolase GatY/KbaY [Thermoanaerobacter sp.]
MSLISSKEELFKAMKGKYAIAAFNIHNLETLKAVMQAASEEKSPIILQTTPSTLKFAGAKYIIAMAENAAIEYGIPTILHLDHCENIETIFECIDLGYTSVMVDGSKLSFEQNADMVKKVVDYAHKKGVQVEAEIGKVGGTEDDVTVSEYEASLTDPNEAVEFVKRTGVDSLAIAIGTAHGMYKGKPKIDFERLRIIRDLVDIPIVLHGASDVPDEMIRKAVSYGINKINIATDLKNAFGKALKEFFKDNPNEYDPRKYFMPAIDAAKQVAISKIKLAGCSNKV